MDMFDISEGYSSFEEGVARIQCPVMVIGVQTDVLFPIWQQRELAAALQKSGQSFSLAHSFGGGGLGLSSGMWSPSGVCLLVGCLTSQQHASVSQGRICSDNCMCCHTEIEVADQTFRLTQSQSADTRPTSPSADPITPGAWQGSTGVPIFKLLVWLDPQKILAQAGFEPGIFRSRGGHLNQPTRRLPCSDHISWLGVEHWQITYSCHGNCQNYGRFLNFGHWVTVVKSFPSKRSQSLELICSQSLLP